MEGSFEFVLGMYSIITGLGVSKLLEGVKNVLLTGRRPKGSELYIGMLVIGLLIHATAWLSLWSLRGVETWKVWSFLLVMLTPVLMFLYSSVTVSDNDPPVDLGDYYFTNARKMHALLIIAISVNALTGFVLLGHVESLSHMLTRLAVVPALLLCALMPRRNLLHRIIIPAVCIGGLIPLANSPIM